MNKFKDILWRILPILLISAFAIVLSQAFFDDIIRTETDKSWDELYMSRDDTAREIGTCLNTNVGILALAAEAIVTNVDSDLNNEEKVLEFLADVQIQSIFDRVDVIFPPKTDGMNGEILLQCGDRVSDAGDKTYEVLAEKGAHISQRVADHHTGNPALHVFAPVPVYGDEDGLPIAILGATVYCSTLAETFQSAHYGENAKLFLVDTRDGNFVFDKQSKQPGNIFALGDCELVPGYENVDFTSSIMLGNKGRTAFLSKTTETTDFMSYCKVENTDFSLAIVVPDEVVFADVNALKSTLLRVGIIEIVLLLLLAVWLYYIMRKSAENKNRAQEAELALLKKNEKELKHQYEDAAGRRGFLEALAANLPGGYHRCTTDHSFHLTFISNSFTEITGYTMEQLKNELDGSYIGIVAADDKEFFLSMAPQLEKDGFIHCAYRIRRRDGSIRWVQDSTQYVERDGEKYYQCALMDITDQVEELEAARKAAEASSQAKSTFLFNISHDIRTPMNAIKGFTTIIKDHKDDAELVGETITKIEKASNTLMTLMNDVLDLARIEKGKEELNLEPVQMTEHGRELAELFSSEMEELGIHFLVEQNITHTYILCDPIKLARIGMNMLSNAKKFTPRGGTITFGIDEIACDEDTVTYRFYTRDTGVGMSKSFLKRAFEQFERERTSTESGVSGSGLGLAIIKEFVELMGGTVTMESEIGKGTEISAVIAFERVKDRKAPVAEPTETAFDMTGKHVLLVEDNDFNREIAKYILEGMHLVVEEAVNGAVCIEKLMSYDAGTYDLILMDIQMPVMDGYTATMEIRGLADRQKASIPIIAMTANAFDEDKRKCIEAGMDGHVGKPIEPAVLQQEIVKVLTR